MFKTCNECEINRFCEDIERCLDKVLEHGFDTGNVDEQNIELRTDNHKGIKPIIIGDKAINKPLNKNEVELIKEMLK